MKFDYKTFSGTKVFGVILVVGALAFVSLVVYYQIFILPPKKLENPKINLLPQNEQTVSNETDVFELIQKEMELIDSTSSATVFDANDLKGL